MVYFFCLFSFGWEHCSFQSIQSFHHVVCHSLNLQLIRIKSADGMARTLCHALPDAWHFQNAIRELLQKNVVRFRCKFDGRALFFYPTKSLNFILSFPYFTMSNIVRIVNVRPAPLPPTHSFTLALHIRANSLCFVHSRFRFEQKFLFMFVPTLFSYWMQNFKCFFCFFVVVAKRLWLFTDINLCQCSFFDCNVWLARCFSIDILSLRKNVQATDTER